MQYNLFWKVALEYSHFLIKKNYFVIYLLLKMNYL